MKGKGALYPWKKSKLIDDAQEGNNVEQLVNNAEQIVQISAQMTQIFHRLWTMLVQTQWNWTLWKMVNNGEQSCKEGERWCTAGSRWSIIPYYFETYNYLAIVSRRDSIVASRQDCEAQPRYVDFKAYLLETVKSNSCFKSGVKTLTYDQITLTKMKKTLLF